MSMAEVFVMRDGKIAERRNVIELEENDYRWSSVGTARPATSLRGMDSPPALHPGSIGSQSSALAMSGG